ncbi:hypothetical protein ACLMJK_009673 [Lecanora helva]
MGTRGFKIVKFRGRYWHFYSLRDSYPEGLGEAIVRKIPKDSAGYQAWLHSQRDLFAQWDDLLQSFLCVSHEKLSALNPPQSSGGEMRANFDELLQHLPPHYCLAPSDIWIEWTYTIDLDLEVFSVDSSAHFRLDRIANIPEWPKLLAKDCDSNRLALCREGNAADLVVNSQSFSPDALQRRQLLFTRVVTPRLRLAASQMDSSHHLRWMLFDGFCDRWREALSRTLLSWKVEDNPFRELTYHILCLAAGGRHLSLIDSDCNLSKDFFAGVVGKDESRGSEAELELVTPLATGYHKKGSPSGSAPDGSMYWFEGALVSLVSKLDASGSVEKAIADAVHFGVTVLDLKALNAVLISIEHVILLKSYPDGRVDHTSILPLVTIPMHLSKGTHARYDNRFLQELEQHSDEAGSDEMHETQISIDKRDSDSMQADTLKSDTGGGQDRIMNDARGLKTQTSKETFAALVTFIEAAKRETLRPMQSDTRLPPEIIAMILCRISDTQTYNACLEVSRQFRRRKGLFNPISK